MTEESIWNSLSTKVQKNLNFLRGYLVRDITPEATYNFFLHSNLPLRDKAVVLGCSSSKVRWLLQGKGSMNNEMAQRCADVYRELSESTLNDELLKGADTRPLYTDSEVRQVMTEIRPLLDQAADNYQQAKRMLTQHLRTVRDDAPTKQQLKRAEKAATANMTAEEKEELAYKKKHDPKYAYKPGEKVNYKTMALTYQDDMNRGVDPRTGRPLSATILAHYRFYPPELKEFLAPEDRKLLEDAIAGNRTEIDPADQAKADQKQKEKVHKEAEKLNDPDFVAELKRAEEQYVDDGCHPKPGTNAMKDQEWMSFLPETSDAHSNMENREEVENNQVLDGLKYKGDDYVIKMDGGPWDDDLRAPKWCKTLTQKSRWYIRHRQWFDHTGITGDQDYHTYRGWGNYGVREDRTDGLRFYPTFRFPTYRQAVAYYKHAMDVDPERSREIVQIDPVDGSAIPVHHVMPIQGIDPAQVKNAEPSHQNLLV